MAETTIEPAPGYWPSLQRAECTCGWNGPTRNTEDPGQLARLRMDRDEHDCHGDLTDAG